MAEGDIPTFDDPSCNGDDSIRILHASTSISLSGQHARQPCFPMRYVLSVLAFFGFFLAQAGRTSFTISLVAMVNYTAELPTSNASDSCPDVTGNHSSPIEQEGEFAWDGTIQSQLLSAFYYGYVVTQLPGGNVADRYGGGRVFGAAVLVSGAVMLVLPSLARWDYRALMAGRIIMGLFQGPLYPSTLALWSKWAPEFERTRLNAIAMSGGTAGVFVAMAATGYMSEVSFLGGWPLPFYLFGGCSIIWYLAWLIVSSDVPKKSRWISQAELAYIEQHTNYLDQLEYKPLPWRQVFTSVPMISLTIFVLFDGFGFYVIFNTLPTYLKQVLRFDASQDGVMIAVPVLICFVVCMLAGPIADQVIIKYPRSKTTIRKIFTLIGDGGMAVAALGIAFSGCSYKLVLMFLTIGYGLNGFNIGGFNMIVLDMAPQYAGTLHALTNFINNIGGFISPPIVNAITGNQGIRTQWQHVFYLTSSIYVLGLIIFMLMGSANLEPWAKVKVVVSDDLEDAANEDNEGEGHDDVEPLMI